MPPGRDPSDMLRNHALYIRLGSWAFKLFGAAVVVMGVVTTFNDPAGLFVILFGLAFVGAGWLTKKLFSPSEGKRFVAVQSNAFTTVRRDGTTAARRSAVLIEVDEDASDDEVSAARTDWAESRFADRPDWVSGRIEAEGQRRRGMFRLAAILWSAFAAAGIAAALIWGDIAWFVAAGATIVATMLSFAAIRDHLRYRKFGATTFVMRPGSARIGGALAGRVETSMSYDRQPSGGFSLTLLCERRWEERTSAASGQPTRTVRRTETIWRAAAQAKPEAAGQGLAARVAFDLPDGAPPSTLGDANEGVFWELRVAAEAPGMDYGAQFLVPVLAPDAKTLAQSEGAARPD